MDIELRVPGLIVYRACWGQWVILLSAKRGLWNLRGLGFKEAMLV